MYFYSYLEILKYIGMDSVMKYVNKSPHKHSYRKHDFISVVTAAMTLDSWMFYYLSVLHTVKPLKTQQRSPLQVVPVIWEAEARRLLIRPRSSRPAWTT